MTVASKGTAGRRVAGAALLVLLATGCTTVGPVYQEPTAEIAEGWLALETHTLASDPPADPAWWRAAFEDPVLDRLVEIAVADNLSLRSAALRVLQARQQLAIATGNRYPQQQQVGGEAQTTITTDDSVELFNIGFNVSWEIDFWGRARLAVQSAAAGLDASVASYDGVMVSLIADVAQSYLAIRTLERRLAVARDNLALQEESVRITTAKLEAGAVSSLDVSQAETLLYGTRAQVSSFELSLQQTKIALAILLGRLPQDLGDLLGEDRPIPAVVAEIAVGMPQELIRRRPDIRASERRLAAQGANLGIAVAELYPQFTLGGSIGTASGELSQLFDSDSGSLSLFGLFNWNIFNYGRLKSNIRLQDAVFQQLLVDYRDTVLQAQGDVESSIVAYLKSQEQLIDFNSAAAAAQRAVDVASTQYEDGLVDFNTVIATLRSLQAQQDVVAATRGLVATNLVQVYRSLGGGWQIRRGQAPDALLPEATEDEMRSRVKAWNSIFDDPQE